MRRFFTHPGNGRHFFCSVGYARGPETRIYIDDDGGTLEWPSVEEVCRLLNWAEVEDLSSECIHDIRQITDKAGLVGVPFLDDAVQILADGYARWKSVDGPANAEHTGAYRSAETPNNRPAIINVPPRESM